MTSTTARLLSVFALVGATAACGSRSAVVAVPPAPSVSPAPSSVPPWKTIEYDGVRVDVPAGWERMDVSRCEFAFVRWAPPRSPCSFKGGVSFYGSATFDPFQGPGLRGTATKWAGYVYGGDYAVWVSGADRDVLRTVLDSVTPRRG